MQSSNYGHFLTLKACPGLTYFHGWPVSVPLLFMLSKMVSYGINPNTPDVSPTKKESSQRMIAHLAVAIKIVEGQLVRNKDLLNCPEKKKKKNWYRD